MRIGRSDQPKQFVFSVQKVEPSSSSSASGPPSSSSSASGPPSSSSSSLENAASSSSSLPCQLNPEQGTLEVISGVSAYGLGITLASYVGSKFHYNILANYDGLPDQMLLFVSGVQVAMVTFNSPYAGTPFVFENTVGDVTTLYCANIISGEVNL